MISRLEKAGDTVIFGGYPGILIDRDNDTIVDGLDFDGDLSTAEIIILGANPVDRTYLTDLDRNRVADFYLLLRQDGSAVFSDPRSQDPSVLLEPSIENSVLSLTSTDGEVFPFPFFPQSDLEDTLFTVVFDSTGGSTVGSQMVLEGDLLVEPVNPTRTGYIFNSWNSDPGLTIPWDFGTNTVTADLTLYADWTALSFTSNPTVVSASPNSITIESVVAYDGTMYAIVVPAGSPLPTAAEVIAGVDYGGVSVLQKAATPYTGGDTVVQQFYGLETSSSYFIHVNADTTAYGPMPGNGLASAATSGPGTELLRWDFSGGSLADSTANANNALPGGGNASYAPDPVTDRFGNPGYAYQFMGSPNGDYITSSNALGITGRQPFSVSLWYRSAGTTGFFRYLHALGAFSADSMFAAYSGDLQQIALTKYNTLKTVSGDNAVVDNTWSHLLTTWDGAKGRIYLDGTEVSYAAADLFTDSMTDSLFFLGTSPLANPGVDDGYSNWNGALDDVRVYDYGLSAAEVAAIHGSESVPSVLTLSYDGNGHDGGTIPVPTTEYTPGSPVAVADNTGVLSRTGYVFAGWNTAPDGSGTWYLPGNTFTMGTTEAVTLFAQWATAPGNGALDLDGASQYVIADAVAGALAGNSMLTIELWVKPAIAVQDTYYIAFNNADTSNNLQLGINTDGEPKIFNPTTGMTNDAEGYILPTGEWSHIAVVIYGAGTFSMFVNGQGPVDTVQNNAASIIPSDYTGGFSILADGLFSIGQEWDAGPTASNFFNGSLDDIRIWDLGRTQNEIAAVMGMEITGNEPGLVAYYNCNSTIGTLHDSTPASRDGTIFP